MVKFLRLNGGSERIQAPALSFTKIELDLIVTQPIDGVNHYFFDSRVGVTAYLIFTATGKYESGGFTTNENGGANVTLSTLVTRNQRMIINSTRALATDDITFFARYTNAEGLKADVYGVKVYNGTTLVAHYDMSTGTVLDQSGNGNHATLTGGTWLDDGTGGTTDPGTEGTTMFDSRLVFYADSTTQADTKQAAYADGTFATDIRHLIYADQSQTADTHIAIYQDGASSQDTAQILYEMSSAAFDTLQELFNDGQVGATPFDVRIQLYGDASAQYDTKQAVYEGGLLRYDVAQVIYESNTTVADVKAVIYADSAIKADARQTIYADGTFTADTLQRILAEFSEYSEVVRIVLEITQRRRGPLSIAQSHSDTLEIVQRKTIELNL